MGRVGTSYKGQQLEKDTAGHMLERNPGVTLVWQTLRASVFPDGRGNYLFDIGRPHRVEWFAHGRQATRDEVLASIESGLPSLLELVRVDPDPVGALGAFQRRVDEALDLVPA
jgi:hypothetical protein